MRSPAEQHDAPLDWMVWRFGMLIL